MPIVPVIILVMTAGGLRIGIDIGGTFTDFVIFDPSTRKISTLKLPSTPQDPSISVLLGLGQILSGHAVEGADIIHGSTVATNALLERKGARTAFIATRGFGDILQIGRQDRPVLYDLTVRPNPQIIPPRLRFEVDERVDRHGNVLQPIQDSELDRLIKRVKTSKAESVAVCLLFSFAHPEHEQLLGERLRSAGFPVSLSSEILPEYREYERASTTAINAYVSPALNRYLSNLDKEMPAATRLRVMQSNGGNISLDEARQNGVRCILSGPAGGVVGCQYIGKHLQGPDGEALKLITFDMGGTSTDVSLIDGEAHITTEALVSGYPIRIPLLDIHTIGAGGGSIAHVDAGGALRVGPQSAGANPGPACYGKGDQPTVTDANLVLGRLVGDYFLGGEMSLEPERAFAALARLGEGLSLTAEQAALGIVAVVNAHMERALRVISVERGHDPQDFTLISFGGAGGLHASDLARGLGIPRILVPPLAATLSAFGMLAADVVKDYALTVMLPEDTDAAQLETRFAALVGRGRAEVASEGIPADRIRVERLLDMRYKGQSYELMVPFSQDTIRAFHQMHAEVYGYTQVNAPVEIVNLRVRAIGEVDPPALQRAPLSTPDPSPAQVKSRTVVFDRGSAQTSFYFGDRLLPGNQIKGPAVVLRADTTILLNHKDVASVDAFGNLIIAVGNDLAE
ncbi:MAG: hydantoinase/oxoprolinase family protein [Chloroflexota bacterium]